MRCTLHVGYLCGDMTNALMITCCIMKKEGVLYWPFSKTVVYMVSGKVSNIHAQTLSSTAESGPKCPGPVAVGSSPMPTFSHFATASLQLQENFSFSTPDEWPRWSRRFDRYRIASGLDKRTEDLRVNTLLYVMCSEAQDISESFGLFSARRKNFDFAKTVRSSTRTLFQRGATVFERAKFNQ